MSVPDLTGLHMSLMWHGFHLNLKDCELGMSWQLSQACWNVHSARLPQPGLKGLPLLPHGRRRQEAERTDLSSPDYEGDEEPKVGTVTAEAAGSGRRNKREADRVPPGENNTEGEERDQDRFWLPERVKNALQKSRNFDEFRKARPFRFLHMFSGEADQLGASIKREAQRARLET